MKSGGLRGFPLATNPARAGRVTIPIAIGINYVLHPIFFIAFVTYRCYSELGLVITSL